MYSYEDVAKALTELSGKNIPYTNVEAAKLAEELKQSGVPEFVAFVIVAFATDTKNHQFEIASSDMQNLIGRRPTALKEALKELYGF